MGSFLWPTTFARSEAPQQTVEMRGMAGWCSGGRFKVVHQCVRSSLGFAWV